MNQTKILTKTQAEAVYSAMCALNNVGAHLDARIYSAAIRVQEMPGGMIVVHRPVHNAPSAEQETYANQSAFATAYGLQQG